jgi:hypothetical protein
MLRRIDETGRVELFSTTYVETMSDEPREVEHEPQVLEGDDQILRQPASPIDPYTPEPHARPGERRAWATMRLAWIPILVVVALIVWATVR